MDAITEFQYVVHAITGVYIDSIDGFDAVRENIERYQQIAVQALIDVRPDLASIEYLDQTAFLHGTGTGRPGHAFIHGRTQKEAKISNSPGGQNYRFIGNMAVVAVYQYWEDHYREEVANLLGKNKSDIREPIMGDLRLLRRSIIHHRGIALREIEKCELLCWFKEGDEIIIDPIKFQEIVRHIWTMADHLRFDNQVWPRAGIL
jgi:hypothetical protein